MDLFHMSLAASPLILAVILVRFTFLYQLPKITFKILWLITLCRLLLPYTLPSCFSIFNLFPIHQAQPLTVLYANGNSAPVLSADTSSIFSLSPVYILWLVGCITVTVFFLRTHIINRKRFIGSEIIEHPNLTLWFQANTIVRPMRIRCSDQVQGPLTYGIFRPIILLPQDTNFENEQQLRFILTHEYIHLCHFDALIKAILAATLCIHWFNPLVWIMFFVFNRDIELTCDEGVLRTLGFSKREAYAFLLINMSAVYRSVPSSINHFSNTALKERVIAIMKLKKKKSLSMILALVISIGIASVFATSASTSPNIVEPEPNPGNFQAKYLYDIRTFYQNIKNTRTTGSLSYCELQVLDMNQKELERYEQMIPDLVINELVSESVAYANLESLRSLLNGDSADFSFHPPHAFIHPSSLSNSCWEYQIQLHNGNTLSNAYYYTVTILIME